jgi:hypothetical protein
MDYESRMTITVFLLLVGGGVCLLSASGDLGQSTQGPLLPLTLQTTCLLASGPTDEIVPPEEKAREQAPVEPSSAENPYMNGRGLRIAGFVLLGMGVADIAIGAILDYNNVYANMYDSFGPRDMGVMFDKIGWIGGIGRDRHAVPLLVAGYVQLGRWSAWEREHGKKGMKFHLHGSRLAVEF